MHPVNHPDLNLTMPADTMAAPRDLSSSIRSACTPGCGLIHWPMAEYKHILIVGAGG